MVVVVFLETGSLVAQACLKCPLTEDDLDLLILLLHLQSKVLGSQVWPPPFCFLHRFIRRLLKSLEDVSLVMAPVVLALKAEAGSRLAWANISRLVSK